MAENQRQRENVECSNRGNYATGSSIRLTGNILSETIEARR